MKRLAEIIAFGVPAGTLGVAVALQGNASRMSNCADAAVHVLGTRADVRRER